MPGVSLWPRVGAWCHWTFIVQAHWLLHCRHLCSLDGSPDDVVHVAVTLLSRCILTARQSMQPIIVVVIIIIIFIIIIIIIIIIVTVFVVYFRC